MEKYFQGDNLENFNFELEEKLGPHFVRSKLLEICGLFWASEVGGFLDGPTCIFLNSIALFYRFIKKFKYSCHFTDPLLARATLNSRSYVGYGCSCCTKDVLTLPISGRWQAPAAVLPHKGLEDKGYGHSRARRAREWPKHASPRARRARGRAKLSARFGACQCYYMFFTIQPKIAIFMAQFKYLNDGQNA